MSSFIEIKDLHFSYINEMEEPPVKTEVLKGINLEIQKGEFVAVLGHNGSGKSTLAKCINAINIPESGTVFVLLTAYGEHAHDIHTFLQF